MYVPCEYQDLLVLPIKFFRCTVRIRPNQLLSLLANWGNGCGIRFFVDVHNNPAI